MTSEFSNSAVPRGRENRSTWRTRLTMKGIVFVVAVAPRSRRFHRAGSQIVVRPSTIWAARTTVIASKTCVTPPVGSGRAGTNISSMIVTAKLFSANTSFIAPSVFGSSLSSHRSSSSLKDSPEPASIRP